MSGGKAQRSIRYEMDQQILAYPHNGTLPTNQVNEAHTDTKTWANLPDIACGGNQTAEHTLYDSIYIMF